MTEDKIVLALYDVIARQEILISLMTSMCEAVENIQLENDKAKKERLESEAELEEFRELKYQECDKKCVAFQYNKKTIDWNHMKRYFGFTSLLKTRKFVESHLKADGLIPDSNEES